MIEATCSACGTPNRIAEADVPSGAKFVNCSSCKSRVALPAKAAAAATPSTGEIDLADLPAPRRQSALGPESSKPAPKSALSAALDVDLPVPKPKAPAGPLAAAAPPTTLELDDLIGGDLPAPKAKPLPAVAPPRPATPAGAPGGPPAIGLVDLPAPKAKPLPAVAPPRPAAPAGAPGGPPAIGLVDLPAPKAKPLPAVAPPKPAAPAGAPGGPPAIGLVDLPAPKPPAIPSIKPPPAAAKPAPDIVDLPAPKASAPGIVDLPAPKASAPGIVDLPAPKASAPGIVDLPAPKVSAAGIVDLPAPKAGGPADLLAPKGFFDDLPQPVPAPRGPADLLAPKGFFDDLPQPAKGGGSGTELTPVTKSEALAPKGFFDDLPQPAKSGGSGTELTPVTKSEALAPKGFFDDLPPANHEGRALDDALELEPSSSEPLELEGDEPELDLGAEAPPPSPANTDQFDDLDLSSPTATASPIRFTPPSKSAPAGGAGQATLPPVGPASKRNVAEAPLELEEPRPTDEAATPKLGPRKKEQPGAQQATEPRAKQRRTKLIAGIVVGVAALGGGGFVMYQRHAAAQERQEQVAQLVAAARKAMVADDAGHWQRAARSATQALEADPKNADALGLAAEATIASVMADGQGGAPKIRKAGKIISDALGEGITGPGLKRAQALLSITTAPDKAPGTLEALLAQAPKDGVLALYLGWAHAAKGDPAAAIKAFDQALANAPAVKLYAIYGRGRAKLALADLEGARTDFKAVLEMAKDFVPAMVGLAAAQPSTGSQQQEADLLAILARKDIDAADPRAVVQAWTLAAEGAARGGRLDAARERFRKAIAIDDKNVPALTGLAEVELRDKKLDTAAELITSALNQTPDDARAQLVASELSIVQGKLDDAEARIKVLAERTPPLPPLDAAQLQVVRGKLLDKQGKPAEAVEAYIAGAKLAGELDLGPTMAAVGKLGELAKAETDPTRATALKERADQLLGALAEKAKDDPQLAMTLGMAYLQVGDAEKAEPWLRRVVDTRANDVDAIYQLGLAIALQGRSTDAIELLQKARALAPDRTEIGLALARTYEGAKRDDEAAQLYAKLLGAAEPSLELRGHAGRFFARHGLMDKAAEQGDKILAVDRSSAVGHFLKGEGLLARGSFVDARKQMSEAVSAERDPSYLDGQARATEQLALHSNNDLQLLDAALHAYMDAAELDPKLFSSQLGQGRIYVQRGEAAKAIPPLQAAWKLRDDAEVAYLIGVAYYMLDQKPVAAQWLEKSSALKPNAEASFRLGNTYNDLNNGRAAQGAYATATRMAIEDEKKTGAIIPWLTEALGNYGDVSYKLHDEPSAKAAWEKYVSRNPRPGAKLDEIKRHLATDLR